MATDDMRPLGGDAAFAHGLLGTTPQTPYDQARTLMKEMQYELHPDRAHPQVVANYGEVGIGMGPVNSLLDGLKEREQWEEFVKTQVLPRFVFRRACAKKRPQCYLPGPLPPAGIDDPHTKAWSGVMRTWITSRQERERDDLKEKQGKEAALLRKRQEEDNDVVLGCVNLVCDYQRQVEHARSAKERALSETEQARSAAEHAQSNLAQKEAEVEELRQSLQKFFSSLADMKAQVLAKVRDRPQRSMNKRSRKRPYDDAVSDDELSRPRSRRSRGKEGPQRYDR